MDGFARLPLTKALRPDIAPAGAWRLASHEIAKHAFSECQHALRSTPAKLPLDWNRVRLCLLPKPNKTPNAPDALRPIALQHPVTKVVTGVLTEKAQKENSTFYRPYPVFAYLPDRSTADCLLQIFGHIREVRSTVASHAKTRARISRSTDLCGGLLITLDLTKAFDAVPRGLIADSIKMLQLSEDLERAFLPCLEGGVYDIRHKGESAQVNSSRGIKQGRKEAPFKWCAATVLLLANLAKSKGLKWIHQHVLAYADDFILRWRYSSVALFTHATKEAAQFLHMLEAQGLKVSAEKSAALITMSGGANTRYGGRMCEIRTRNAIWCVSPRVMVATGFPLLLSSTIWERLLDTNTLKETHFPDAWKQRNTPSKGFDPFACFSNSFPASKIEVVLRMRVADGHVRSTRSRRHSSRRTQLARHDHAASSNHCQKSCSHYA